MKTITPQPVALAFGSNLGDRRRMIDDAVRLLDSVPGLELTAFSRLYETPPWGDTGQPDFLNSAAFGFTTLDPDAILRETMRVEGTLGKRVVRQWGPRCIDIDLLHVGDRPFVSDTAEIPHPRVRDRPFVYLPLADLPIPSAWKALFAPSPEGAAIEHTATVADGGERWPSRIAPRRVELVTNSAEETEAVGFALGGAAVARDVFALDGPLGAGKTAFVHGLARGLAIGGPIPSPSYTLCRDYAAGRLPFQHWDFYRLESEDDLESTGFLEKACAPAVIAIEWAGRFPDDLPRPTIGIRIERGDAADRRILHLDIPPGGFHLRAAFGQVLFA